MHTVGTAEEARRSVTSGVDVVVAQGWEAGGHVWGTVATLPLVPAVVDAVAPARSHRDRRLQPVLPPGSPAH
jgi:nitronate monooxygenase